MNQTLLNCYLCNCSLTNSINYQWLLEQSTSEDGRVERTLASVLENIIDFKLEMHDEMHAAALCLPCVVAIETYESLAQQVHNLRERIINTYKINAHTANAATAKASIAADEHAPATAEDIQNTPEAVDEQDDLEEADALYEETCETYIEDEIDELQETEEIDIIDDAIEAIKQKEEEEETNKTAYNYIEAVSAADNEELHNEYSYECATCGQGYNNLQQLHEHMDIEHQNAVDSSNTRNVYVNHKEAAQTPNETTLKCFECNEIFETKKALRAHQSTHITSPHKLHCTFGQCKKSFWKESTLRLHMTKHNLNEEFPCELCGKIFKKRQNLKLHLVVHSGEKPYVCVTCGKRFARQKDMLDHERIHTGERPYKCDLCEATFTQYSNLSTHKRATHFNQKSYKCEQCERTFKRRRLLEYHTMAAHTGERPYACDQCDATFIYPEYYKKHLQIHSGIKNYSCEVCGKLFTSRDNRNTHRFVHSNKKPYECLECGEGFMRKPQLLAHMKASRHVSDTIIINEPQINNVSAASAKVQKAVKTAEE